MTRNKTCANQGISSRNIPSSSLSFSTTQGEDAMDLSAVTPLPRGPLSDEEKERRRKFGLCHCDRNQAG